MLPKELTTDIKNRLKSVEGQIRGILRMLDEPGCDPEAINIQFKSVRKGLEKTHFLLLDEVYRKTLALKIVKAVEACPGNCGHEEKIAFLRKEFPTIGLDELSQVLKEMWEIEAQVRQHNNENGTAEKI